MRCCVKNCRNYDNQGEGVYLDCYFSETYDPQRRLYPKWICMPCFIFMTTMDGTNSQIYRNALIAEKESENDKT